MEVLILLILFDKAFASPQVRARHSCAGSVFAHIKPVQHPHPNKTVAAKRAEKLGTVAARRGRGGEGLAFLGFDFGFGFGFGLG